MIDTVIRTAGPYTISYSATDGLLCNGKSATILTGKSICVDTGCFGANGKRDLVGLTAEQYATVIRCGAEALAARQAAYARTHAAEIAASDAREAQARAYDRLHNECGEGYNPFRTPVDTGSTPDEPQV